MTQQRAAGRSDGSARCFRLLEHRPASVLFVSLLLGDLLLSLQSSALLSLSAEEVELGGAVGSWAGLTSDSGAGHLSALVALMESGGKKFK